MMPPLPPMKWLLPIVCLGILAGIIAIGLSPSASQEHTLTVFAAAALTDPLKECASVFEQEHPGVKVELNFASASMLCAQIEGGARASVYAAPYPKYAEKLISEGFARSYRPFAYDSMVVAVRTNGSVHSLSDLTKEGVRVVIGQKSTPIGIYAREVISRLNASGLYGTHFEEKVLSNVVSEEDNTKYVYSKVVLGEADAGFVLRTDITNPTTSYIDIPEGCNVDVCCVIAVLDEQDPYATKFEQFVLSPEGQRIFQRYGFEGVEGA